MPLLGDMTVRLGLDASGFHSGLATAKNDLAGIKSSAEGAGQAHKGLLGSMLAVAGGTAIIEGAGAAFGALSGFISDSVQQAMDAQQGIAQTAAVIKSTGGVAGITADHVDNLSNSLSKVTTYADDTVRSGENMLLTFTNIGTKGGVFDQATKTALDMSTALGTNVTQASMMLGKALNDPIKGVSALQRVGVTLDDQQKKLIETYQKHGNIAGAQTVILKELQREFGGSAEAAGGTFAGKLQILNNQFDQVKQNVGGAIIPVFSALLSAAMPVGQFLGDKLVGALNAITNPTGAVVQVWDGLLELWDEVSQPLGGLITDLQYIGNEIMPHFSVSTLDSVHAVNGLVGPFGIITKAAGELADGINQVDIFVIDLANHFNTGEKTFTSGETAVSNLITAFDGFGKTVQSAVMPVVDELGNIFTETVVPGVVSLLPHIERLGEILIGDVVPAGLKVTGALIMVGSAIATAVLPAVQKILPYVFQFGQFLIDKVGAALQFVSPFITKAAGEVTKFAGELSTRLAPVMKLVSGIIVGELKLIQTVWSAVWPVLSSVLKGVWDVIVGVIQVAWSVVTGIFKVALDLITGNWSGAWNDLKSMLSGVWDGIKNIVGGAFQVLGSLVSGGLKLIGGIFGGLWGIVSGALASFWNGLMNFFGSIPGAAANALSGLGGAILGVLKGIGSFEANIFHWLSDHAGIFKGAVDGLGHLLGVPGYARGGYFAGDTPFLVGERGPEIVFPGGSGVVASNDQIHAALNHPNYDAFRQANRSGNSGGYDRADVTLVVDGQVLARVVGASLVKEVQMRTGVRVR